MISAVEIESQLRQIPDCGTALHLWRRGLEESIPEAFCLNDRKIRQAARELHFPPEFVGVLSQCLLGVSKDPVENRLLWFCQELFAEPLLLEVVLALPMIKRDPLFPILLFLLQKSKVERFYQEKGISKEILEATLADLLWWIRHYQEKNGSWGVSETAWLIRHFTGKIFQVGRLQFERHIYDFPWVVLRNKKDRQLRLVAAEGGSFRQDGQFIDADHREEPIAWKSALKITETSVEGYRANALGCCERRPEIFSWESWELVVKPGDLVWAVHIPGVGRMDPDLCQDSFDRAELFIDRHFKEERRRVFTCASWLLDPQFATFLNPQSNIVTFLKRWNLAPLPGSNSDTTFEKVYGSRQCPEKVEIDGSSLQKKLFEFVQNGGLIRGGLGVIAY